MFSWATSTFAKLSETVAPPATDGASRFVYCCQRGDEEGAIACVPEIPGAGCVVNNAKGQVPLHLACLHSMPKLIRVLLNQPGASLDVPDAAGNTPLHCACLSNNQQAALDTVKMMIQECGCNVHVAAKNNQGQTPYDVAVLNSVRQYLLPLQLQQETQQAIDNGGAGLPPGIDMGGLKIDRSHLPPPPMGGPGNLGGPPASPYVTTPMNGGGHGPPASPYAPTPMGGGGGGGNYPHSTNPPSSGGGGYQNNGPAYGGAAPMNNGPAYGGAAPMNNGPAYGGAAPMAPGAPVQGAPAMPASPYQSQSAPVSEQVPPTPPPAPSSGSSQHAYSRNGSSSAAFYQPKTGSGRNFVKPDGFHSSSSDKSLQQKYGHSATNGNVSAIPPPPSSNGSSYSGAGGPGQVQSSPGSLNNPYSGGGGVTRSAKGRYPTYDPITGQQMQPPAPSSGGYNGGGYGAPGAGAGMGQMPTPTNFNTFNPAAAQQPAAAVPSSPGQGYGYASPTAAASPAAPGGYGFSAPSPGAQNMNAFAASPVAASAAASMSDFPPPPIPRHMQGPAATFAAPPVATEQPPMEASPLSPDRALSSPRSQPIASPRSAEQVFGTKPSVVPTTPAEVQQPDPTTFAPAAVPAQECVQDPAATFAAPPAATESPPMVASPLSPSQAFSSPRSQPIASPRSAEQVFGAKPSVVPTTPVEVQRPDPTTFAPAAVPAQEYVQDPAATFAAPPAATESPHVQDPAATFAAPPAAAESLHVQDSASTLVAPPAAMEPPPIEVSSPTPAQSLSSPRSAEQVFGARPTAVQTSPEVQQPAPAAPSPAQGHVQDSAATFAAPPAATEPPPLEVSPPSPAQFSPPKSQPITSPRSAEQVFGAKPTVVPSPTEMQVPDPTTTAPAPVSWQPLERTNTMDSAASAASELFSRPPAATPITIAEDSPPPRQSDLLLKRTSTEDNSASTASDVFSKGPNDSTLATDVFSKPVEAVDDFSAAAPPQVQQEPETVPPVEEARELVLESTSSVMPQATDVFSKPMEAVDAFATAPPQAQPELETVTPVHEVAEPALNSTTTAAPHSTDVFSKPQELVAADNFATGPPQAQAEQETTSPAQEESGEAAPLLEAKSEVTEESTGAGEELEEDMTDVPLSPYRVEQEGDPTTRAPPPMEPDNSLFSAIGMPPPPFTKKYTR
jgi:hypothetical protein